MKAITFCFKIACILIILLSNAYAQTSLNVTKLGSWYSGNSSTVIFTQGNYAYHGSKDIFTVFDISTISAGHITGIGQYVAPNNIQRIQIVGNFAYLLIQNTGLQIVDVSDPYNPVASGMLLISDYSTNLIVEGNNVFITSYNGLTVIDVSNPSNPFISGTYVPSGNALLHDVKVQGNYAFVASQASGVRVCNIQNLSAITEVGSYYPGNYFKSQTLQIYGNYLYAFHIDETTSNKRLKIEVLDIINPANPIQINSVLVSSVNSTTSIHYNYLSDNRLFTSVDMSSNNLSSKVIVFDLSNPSLPLTIETIIAYDLPFNANVSNPIYSTADNNNYLFYPTIYGFCVYNIANLSSISEVTFYFDKSATSDFIKNGNLIYTCNLFSQSYNGIWGVINVFDVTNPDVPLFLHSHPLTQNSPYWHSRIVIQGQYLYITNLRDGSVNQNGMVIFDISNPLNFIELGSFKIFNSMSAGIQVLGNFAYICFMENGLYIVDISNPSAPTLVGSTVLTNNAEAMLIKISGNYAFITDKVNLLHVIDVANPATPVQIATHILSPPPGGGFLFGKGNHLTISNNLAFVPIASPAGTGVVITDISNPYSPQNIASYNEITNATDLSLAGNIMYCSDFNNGIQVVDISNLASTNLGGYFYIFSASSLRVIGEGDLIYFITNNKGLYILKNEYQTNVEVMPKKPDLLKIYPNPMHDFAVVQIPEAFHQSQNITIRVFDIHGREMNVPVYYHHSEIIIKRNALNEGLYHIEMRDENRNIAKGRFIVN